VPTAGAKSHPLDEQREPMLAELLRQKHDIILNKWFNLTIETYPADTSKFLKNQKDQFQNPVGHTIRTETEALFDALLDGAEPEALAKTLDNLVRIRVVQEISPAQGTAFIFLLKTAVRGELVSELSDNAVLRELLEFESKIDGLALAVFDVYVGCKEKIYEIRAREHRMRSAKLVEQVNKLYGGLDDPGHTKDNNA
jgi:RsbRD-like negative regulator of sigma factor